MKHKTQHEEEFHPQRSNHIFYSALGFRFRHLVHFLFYFIKQKLKPFYYDTKIWKGSYCRNN